jgi:hypothetical protein
MHDGEAFLLDEHPLSVVLCITYHGYAFHPSRQIVVCSTDALPFAYLP